MIQDQRRDGVRERHRRDDLGADLRMDPDLLKLFVGERTWLREDVLGDGQLSDVVQQRGCLDRFDLGVGHAECLGQARGIDLDAANVVVRRVILGLDGQRERFHRGQMQLAHPPGLLALDRDAPTDSQRTREIHEYRHQQQAGHEPE